MVLSILILDLVKQKRFYPYEYISGLEKYKERLSNEEKFDVYWQIKKLVINSENDFKVWDRFEMKKKMKDYHDLHIKCDVLLFEKFIKPLFESTRFRVGSNA